jgi:hypothetical protein
MGWKFSRADESNELPEVTAIQQCLIRLGYDLGSYGADGKYGARTEAAIRSFQKSAGLNEDGVVGPSTWNKLAERYPDLLAPTEEIESYDTYTVPGTITALAQPSSETCWAIVLTMMASWRDGLSYTPQAVLDSIGNGYRQKYDNNLPLYGSEVTNFLEATGLVGEPPQSYSPEGLFRLIESYGPIWITAQAASGDPFSLHARIAYGWYGDGTPQGTLLRIIDPMEGSSLDEAFEDVMEKYEEVGRLEGVPLFPQILHY